ncbi:MAG: methyltransferase domain-containing protein [Phycisphaerales bacterium]|nr:MAG: methyltransferase domain-containing protein [Phycisphaerales bacterium]
MGAPARPGPGGPRGGKPRGGAKDAGPTTARTRFGRNQADRARDVRVIYEDAHLLIVDKPPGLAVLADKFAGRGPGVRRGPGTPPVGDDLLGLLRHSTRQRARLFAVSRLDPEASGLVVFAKQEADFEPLKTEFVRGKADQFYTVVAEGEMPDANGTLRAALLVPRTGPVRAMPPGDYAREREVAHAVTHYRVLEAGQGRSLLRLRMETNRRDQPRAHLAAAEHPIVGDRAYGKGRSPEGNPLHRLVMHASEVAFTHPGSGERVRMSSPAPSSFYELVGAPAPERASEADRARGITPASESAGEADPESGTRPSPRPAQGSWENVAEWYDELIADRRSDHYDEVIVPGTLGLLGVRTGERVLDVACGQGVLAQELAGLGAEVVGIDGSPTLISAASARAGDLGETGARVRFEVGDARALDVPRLGKFQAAACVMALMNMDRIGDVLSGCAATLEPGGRLVCVVLHPAFRAPGQTQWGWLDEGGKPVQFRRVDAYLSEASREIVMNPGEAASGAEAVKTVTYNRPISAYVRAAAAAGLVIDAMEEWASQRQSEPGPRASAENRARREIPMFLAFRAVRLE